MTVGYTYAQPMSHTYSRTRTRYTAFSLLKVADVCLAQSGFLPPAVASMKQAVVVGASRGLGLALTAQLLLRRSAQAPASYRVLAAARSPSLELDQLEERHRGRLTTLDGVDVTKRETLQRLADAVEACDLLLNVAGVLHEPADAATAAQERRMPERALKEVDPEWMERVFRVNAVGPVLTTQALRPKLREGAVVANLSARVGSIGDNKLGGWWSYRMSKAALNQATRNTAIELRRSNVIAVALHPGTTDTELSRPFQRNVRPEKLFSADKTAEMLLDVIDGLGMDDSGGFFDYAGKPIEW